MAILPDHVSFVCESCEKKAKPVHIQRHGCRCRRCGGESWTVVAHYRDSKASSYAKPRRTMAQIMLDMAIGGVTSGWATSASTADTDVDGSLFEAPAQNDMTIGGVSAEQVRVLASDLTDVREQVADFFRAHERQVMLDRGAKTCTACNALFVPRPNKPWTTQGYCSKQCQRDEEGVVETIPESVPQESHAAKGRSNIAVQCHCGHQFEVMGNFSGCVRRCPKCGEKCQVP